MEGMLWIFSPEKSDDFGWVRTRELGYQRPALDYALDRAFTGNDRIKYCFWKHRVPYLVFNNNN
jgi:hypothetical protein